MFESDDWDLDQDFLNDVDEKAVQFYSQTDNHEIEPAKRRKIEICSDPIFSSDNTKCEDKTARKNFILGMFSKSDSKNVSDSAPIKSQSNSSVNNEFNQLHRKNLVLDILQKKDTQEKHVQNNPCVLNNAKNLNHQKTQSKFGTTSYTKFHELNSIVKNNKTNFQTSNNANTSRQADNKSNFQLKQNSLDESRRQLLLDVLKPSSLNNSRITNNASKNNSTINKSSVKINQAQHNKKMTLIRRFPGPAGLLPDDMDTSVPAVSVLKTLEESENERLKESPESNLSVYCSQDTKNLFTEGAWQLMLNDLSDDFLKGYEIASVKQMASANGCQSTKVQFMAGVLEHIDYSHDNPPVVLKDFTDSIQGIVHRDIPLKYPGLLEPNVVVLLHDVGLLKTSGSLSLNKYHILVSPSSLLGIYSNKGQIIHTPHMESILGISSRKKIEKKNDILPKSSKQGLIITQNSKNHNNNNKEGTKNVQDFKKKSNFDTSINDVFENTNESINFDVMDDFSFSVSPKAITNSQNEKNFSSPTAEHLKRMNKPDKQSPKNISIKKTENMEGTKERSTKLYETLKKFAVDTSRHKICSPIIKTSKSDAERSTKADMLIENLKTGESNNDLLLKTPKSISGNLITTSNPSNTSQPKSKHTVRSKLLQFKSNDALTPPEPMNTSNSNTPTNSSSTTEKSQNDNSSIEKLNSLQDIFSKDENDSDDEMLSQLDVDTIFSNYNQTN